MKSKAAWIILASVLWISWAQAATTTNAWFYSKCSGRATGVTVGSSTRFAVEIKGLAPRHKVRMKVRYWPDGDSRLATELAQESLWTHTAGNDGRVLFQFEFEPPTPEQGQSRLWIAQVTWNDMELPAITGDATSRIYLALSGEEKLYALSGPALCRWQLDPILFHPYRSNQAAYAVSLEQEVDLRWLAPDHGIELQSMGPAGASTPGWFFPQWEGLFGDAGRKAKQSWQIPMNSGGFLATQVKFTRYPVREFSQTKINGCYTWGAGREGTLDVGARETEFFLVPAELAVEDARAIEFIKSAYPMTQSCDGSLPRAALGAKVWMSSAEYPLYFYPQ